jgi:hypothetical protein
MRNVLFFLVPVLFLVGCNLGSDPIANPKFQHACIDSGGTVYPTRFGYGGCMIDGFSYREIDGVRFHN